MDCHLTSKTGTLHISHAVNLDGMKHVLRVVVSAAALAVATALVPGIQLQAASNASKTGTLLVVALIFGVINTVLKPIIKMVGCAFYVLTLGLAALVVNGLLLWLTSAIAGHLKVPFHVVGFVAAVEGALIVGIVSWLLHLVLGDERKQHRPREHDGRP